MTHLCHHPTCGKVVPARYLACGRHWAQLPKALRDRIWAAYAPGQEIRKDPIAEYLEAFEACQEFWKGRTA